MRRFVSLCFQCYRYDWSTGIYRIYIFSDDKPRLKGSLNVGTAVFVEV